MVNKSRSLGVWMNGIQAGELTKSPAGALSFTYSTSWLEIKGARPISLSMPLRRQPYIGEVVFNYFDNLLPDNSQIRERIQTRFKAMTSHPFDLLAAIGMDCVGAVQIVPSDELPPDVRRIEGEPLSDLQVAQLLNNYRAAPLGMHEEYGDDFRISIAGAQEKTALLWKDNAWHRPLGTTPTTHILKLPMGVIEHSGMDLSESCENEWLCLKIADAFDLPVCKTEVVSFNEVKVLVVERFDRRYGDGWIIRLPQEDMCQALGISPNLKYESDGGPGIEAIMRFLRQSHEARHDRVLFFKSQILFWLLAGIDGHGKNFSLFIRAGGRFQTTPLYDIMSAHPLLASKQLQVQKIKMAMALTGKNRHYHWADLQPRHFISTAKQADFNVKTAQVLLAEMMDSVDDAIDQVSVQLPGGFPDRIASPIFDGMQKVRDRYVRLRK
ncbi:MAG: type II toxin-antitoxin system HipA family toxin [Sedimenticola sp.]